jgi:O-antigen/teichoic acid export membrane protein
MPMSLVGNAVSRVFLQQASELNTNNDVALAPLVESLFRRLLIVALLPCMILTLVGREFFDFVFGAEWAEAGVFAQLLAPWGCIWFISSPLSSLYYVLEKQREDLKFQSAIFVTRFVALGFGGLINEPRVAVFLFSLSGIFVYGYLIKIVFIFAQLKPKVILMSSLKTFCISLLFLLPVLVLKVFGMHAGLLLSVSGVVTALFFLTQRRNLLKA